ncbi:ATP-binding cassette domain-containing protein [Occultella glacieicola]|uniref:ATP-binding cassette domain-containing protein n=1 Tax=Occultella glacieicola TaxID=2518684 RepID=A0ABY2E0M8_9MICO|nr:ATP-binding cassette domain-containing protein [Occultella glacieicola]TDE90860.1 ATP-binding cassette domain-containing protein [Occultella glacieicola]
MTEEVLVTRGLTKRYGEQRAVDDVSIRMERGRVYGLIGSNGAGKTTLMRMISGLAIPTAGTISLFGSDAERPRQQDLARIGTLIETPTPYGAMTARQNMHVHRLIRGVPDPNVETELLELVGLADTGRKRVSNFSLGMRQRLGIALALISAPELLVLDEPVNGLDPAGVVEVRRLIRDLAIERGITVLLSSHNLPELYQTATDYIIVDRGAVRRTLTLAELDAQTQRFLRIEAPDTERLTTVLEQGLGTSDFTVMPDRSVRLTSHLDDAESVLRTLVRQDVWPTAFSPEGESLESFFLTVTGAGRS